jgi:hypothetical protein
MKPTKVSDKAYRFGNKISDRHVSMLFQLYARTATYLFIMGDLYKLAWRDAYDQQERLSNIIKARGLRIQEQFVPDYIGSTEEVLS